MNKIICALLIISVLMPLSVLRGSGDNETVDIIREYELPENQRKAWNEFKDGWMRTAYRSCLKTFRLGMTCASCVYIYMKAEIKIGKDGRLESYRKTGENVCGKKITPPLEKCFITPVEQQTFPDELKGVKFETMLGTGLKC